MSSHSFERSPGLPIGEDERFKKMGELPPPSGEQLLNHETAGAPEDRLKKLVASYKNRSPKTEKLGENINPDYRNLPGQDTMAEIIKLVEQMPRGAINNEGVITSLKRGDIGSLEELLNSPTRF